MHLKEGQGPDGLATLKIKPQLHSMVAKQLCQNLSGRNSIIFTGPSITSLNLYQEFEKQGRSFIPFISLLLILSIYRFPLFHALCPLTLYSTVISFLLILCRF